MALSILPISMLIVWALFTLTIIQKLEVVITNIRLTIQSIFFRHIIRWWLNPCVFRTALACSIIINIEQILRLIALDLLTSMKVFTWDHPSMMAKLASAILQNNVPFIARIRLTNHIIILYPSILWALLTLPIDHKLLSIVAFIGCTIQPIFIRPIFKWRLNPCILRTL